jgi:transposase
MVVGAALDGAGRPVSCEMWAGNHTDAKALLPAVERLRERFGIRKATVVADRGMISKGTISDLEKRGLGYILGARMRSVHAGRFNARRWSGAMRREVKLDVLSRAGRYREVRPNLRVKEVSVEGRRYSCA